MTKQTIRAILDCSRVTEWRGPNESCLYCGHYRASYMHSVGCQGKKLIDMLEAELAVGTDQEGPADDLTSIQLDARIRDLDRRRAALVTLWHEAKRREGRH